MASHVSRLRKWNGIEPAGGSVALCEGKKLPNPDDESAEGRDEETGLILTMP
jgi:hypothetical protein